MHADGGGVRGLSSLYILEHLTGLVEAKLQDLKGTAEREELLPAQIFDHVVGTSTGGYETSYQSSLHTDVWQLDRDDGCEIEYVN